MSAFFTIGIVLNVVFAGLAFYWLWRQRMPKPDTTVVRQPESGSGENTRAPVPEPADANDYLADHAHLLISSYRHWTGRDLVEPRRSRREQARALFEAAFMVASHGGGIAPVFNYGNRAALALFETGWGDFTSMPSHRSAEPAERAERARLLERVSRDGFIDDYSGMRVTATGRRFRIHGATVWNVIDAGGAHRGQAVMFRDPEYC